MDNMNRISMEEAIELLALSTPVITIIEGAFTALLPDQCFGCDRAKNVCSMYEGREHLQHSRVGGCAGRTHDRVVKDEGNGFKLNPLKASKRGQKGNGK